MSGAGVFQIVCCVARYELIHAVRSGVLPPVVIGLLSVSSLLAILGLAEQTQRQAAHQSFSNAERTRWLSLPQTDPHVASHIGIYVLRPPAPLGWFDPGVDSSAGSWEHLEAHRSAALRDRPVRDAIASMRPAALSPAVLWQSWIPLLVLLTISISHSSEIEGGTLRLLAAQGVPISAWSTVKTVVLLAIIVAAAAIPVCLTMLVFHKDEPGARLPDPAIRLATLAGAHVVHLVTCAFLGAACGLLGGSRRRAMALAVAFWTWDALLAPVVCGGIAEARFPAPTGLATWKRVEEEVGDRHARASEEFERLMARLRAEHGVQKTSELPVNPIGLFWILDEQRTTEAFDRIRRDIADKTSGQDRVRVGFSWISPARSVESLSMTACGSSPHDIARFERSIEEYRLRMNQRLNEEKAYNRSIDESRAETLPGADLWKQIPQFRYVEPRMAEVAPHWNRGLVPLAAWVLASAALFGVSVRRVRYA